MTEKDPIKPDYYKSRKGFDVLDFIHAFGLSFGLGNAVKYIARAGKKDPDTTLQDLRKAKEYIEREIRLIEANDNMNLF